MARAETGEIAAYVQVNDYEAMTEVTGKREAFVGKVGTLPGDRRRGLAGVCSGRPSLSPVRPATTSRLWTWTRRTPGALRVYERAGFRVTQRFTL